ncbi:MAG: riboflavin synthase [Gemmatimonas sp.]|jgi:riboflavin synthase|uniref:riboflavin synthase n=1 Tax=Gemmatimonas sp. TaxID=1962908 RepID=UPI00391F47BC|nr:riboflavin synthase [Gemmatimonadota bacterium]
MFTGLVDDVGLIEHVADTPAGRELRIRCRYTDLTHGESIAVNGACLTVREHGQSADGQGWFTVAAVVTTLARTTIGDWVTGGLVNLERAMQLGDRLGGHLVLGHVDGLGRVVRTAEAGDAWLIDLELPIALRPLMVDKGSIAVNGVSLTVNALLDEGVQLSIIEYTRRHTTLGELVAGTCVHVEADVLAKHVERLLAPYGRLREGVLA